ncbi:hypothetical protein CRYUN_Cryun24cG0053400 [Craigia yunnanensis]
MEYLSLRMKIIFSYLLMLFAPNRAALTAVQLLWVNMIMDTLGALALATEPPTDELMKRSPVGKKGNFISNVMWRNILGQSFCQFMTKRSSPSSRPKSFRSSPTTDLAKKTTPTASKTKASVGCKAGVKEYKLICYTPEYEVKYTNILTAFRVTNQPGVPLEEAGAAVAAESSTVTWTTVWTDRLTSLDRYRGRCYHIESVAGEENQYICYVAYPLGPF